MSGTERQRRRGGGAAMTTFAILAVGAGAMAATGVGLPRGGGAPTGPSDRQTRATATVDRQTLVDTRTETGSLTYGETVTVKGSLGGTVTRLPGVGSIVARGSALYMVDNKPVVLLYGSLPAYRTLKAGQEGEDVEQLEQNLAALGYTGFTVDRKFTEATATAVRKWQAALGLDESGEVEAGRVHYASGQVRVDSRTAASGDALQPGKELLAYSGTRRVVEVTLGMDEQRLAAKGTEVTLNLPTGTSTRGEVAATRTVTSGGGGGSGGAGSASGSTGGSTGGGDSAKTELKVTVSVDDQAALEGLDQSSTDVLFTASKRDNVLTVPTGALLALTEGGYGVQVVEATGTRILPVTTGMFANGRVEVSGDGLAEGTAVGVPS
ncbi:peptidoglycan-binding protein [Kitasatospora sp. NPDC056184]|uniref:peptidoglycan-binding protein n=1 Tax=Kitasatospora sp. NPDC056184 TaxID=3345738 RepID=UPI0035D869B5